MPWIEHSIKDDDEEVEDMKVDYYFVAGDAVPKPCDVAIPDWIDAEAAAKIREIIDREKKKKIKFEEVIDDDTWS